MSRPAPVGCPGAAKLIEGVLAVVPGSPQKISPVRVVTSPPSARTDLPLTHRQLLQIGGEPRHVVRNTEAPPGFRVEEVGVPQPDQAQQHRRV